MNKLRRSALVFGLTLGLLSIILGAFGAHGLKSLVDPDVIVSFKTGVHYQMTHAIFLILLVLLSKEITSVLSSVVFRLTWVGVTLFSGSIYFIVLNKAFDWVEMSSVIGLLTPIGGMLLIASWSLVLKNVIVFFRKDNCTA